ncbi:hypothetical protein RE628_19135 [Paenibacillus sp. D2_2]|uniref:hypothetical protein n=1 Tax=Paenibacillus sp. D2_2 TaxID=3073092 RepID=UPI002814F344|nr:hypothetical protein [Paenibacillus sp. D2_2]WMT39518.1 hypothetical protein RE628_19135 [Paenibacillus sp. D2_2]
MNLTPLQQNVLLTLTTEWQTPIQIAAQLSNASEDTSSVNQPLKDLVQKGLVQVNPIIMGMYRLTPDGTSIKSGLLGG